MKKSKIVFVSFLFAVLSTSNGCNSTKSGKELSDPDKTELSDEDLFALVQKQTFMYFWDGAEPNSGLARERYHVDEVYPDNDKNIVTSGGTGFGLMAMLVAAERGFIEREELIIRLDKIANFLAGCDRFHGVWPHWINGETGKVKPFSPKDDGADLVETSFLAAGMLCVRQYLRKGDDPEEQALSNKYDELWKSIEWNYFRGENRENVLFWHWSPTHGWDMNFRIRGYNECLITYVLAASSPDYAIPPSVYHEGWASSGAITDTSKERSLPLIHQGNEKLGGPLFWAHYSFLGLDPRNLKDTYADYWTQNTTHVELNRQHCIDNPHNFKGYGEDCWGLTASYSTKFYAAHSPGNDVGVISPTAALSSFPYAPESCNQVMRNFYDNLGDKIWGKYGFYDAFSIEENWYPQKYLAIDQGPIVVMMENYRTGLLWDLFMSCQEVQTGLNALGFRY